MSAGERGRRGDDRRPRVPAWYGVRAGPGHPLLLRAASPPAAAAGQLRPGLPVAGRAGRGRVRPLRRQPARAEATDVRQGVGGLGGRAGRGVSAPGALLGFGAGLLVVALLPERLRRVDRRWLLVAAGACLVVGAVPRGAL